MMSCIYLFISFPAVCHLISGGRKGGWKARSKANVSCLLVCIVLYWFVKIGNEVLFSLETASDFVRLDKKEYFGFRCLVSGFEWKNCSGLSRLEMELAYLGGFCAHQLIRKDLVLPPVSGSSYLL